jgi:polyisoprenoid-binding protein YceI
MKKTLLFLLLTTFIINGQDKWATKIATVSFEASVLFFEPIQAENKTVNCQINTKKATIVFVVFVKDFHFEKSLMQQHFNENYLESNKYPKAIFKGKIERFELSKISVSPSIYMIAGSITIHDQSKKMRLPASFKKIGKQLELHTSFNLNTHDFEIQIPFLVRDKIAKNVHVNLLAVLQ